MKKVPSGCLTFLLKTVEMLMLFEVLIARFSPKPLDLLCCCLFKSKRNEAYSSTLWIYIEDRGLIILIKSIVGKSIFEESSS